MNNRCAYGIVRCATLALLCTACSTIPRVANREPSPYLVSDVINSEVSFRHNIGNVTNDAIRAVELWYNGRPVDRGMKLERTGTVMRVFYGGFFSWRAGATARVRLMTDDGYVHEFILGDPWANDQRTYTGTRYKMD